jgi:hypothetical protein
MTSPPSLVSFTLLLISEVRTSQETGDTPQTNRSNFIEMIDKAAANLATKGPELENHIREANKDGRFNFLNPNDPYYAYYRFKYQEVKDGKGKLQY